MMAPNGAQNRHRQQQDAKNDHVQDSAVQGSLILNGASAGTENSSNQLSTISSLPSMELLRMSANLAGVFGGRDALFSTLSSVL